MVSYINHETDEQHSEDGRGPLLDFDRDFSAKKSLYEPHDRVSAVKHRDRQHVEYGKVELGCQINSDVC